MVGWSIRRAQDDAPAIEEWIAARCDVGEYQAVGRPVHSARACRREASRFALWLRAERGRCLAEARLSDRTDYRTLHRDVEFNFRFCYEQKSNPAVQ